MELVFFDRKHLSFKDYGFVDEDFDIQLDLVVTQRSSFLIHKTKLNTVIGDILIVKDPDFSYIGIVESIERQNDFQTLIHAVDFKEVFNLEILASSFTGNIAGHIEQTIRQHFIESMDDNQNLQYLSIENNESIQGDIYFEEDRIISLSELIEQVNKAYGINLAFGAMYVRGRVSGIKLRIYQTYRGMKLKSNLKNLTDLVINDSEAQLINKVVFYPKADNVAYTTLVVFFLLKDGQLSNVLEHEGRYQTVNLKAFIYGDTDFPTLELKARSEMLSAKLDHHITFTINTEKMNPQIKLGDFVEFITENKSYNTIVTGLRYQKSLKVVHVTLGEFRIKLTDKIKLLNKTVRSSATHMTHSSVSNLDGGEF